MGCSSDLITLMQGRDQLLLEGVKLVKVYFRQGGLKSKNLDFFVANYGKVSNF